MDHIFSAFGWYTIKVALRTSVNIKYPRGCIQHTFCFLFRCSVLHSAAYWDCASLIECYMKRNSTLMVTDAEGRTPLHYVFINKRYWVTNILISIALVPYNSSISYRFSYTWKRQFFKRQKKLP